MILNNCRGLNGLYFSNKKGTKENCLQNRKCNSKVLFDDDLLAALMSGRKYDVIPQNCDCLRENNVRTLVFRNEVRMKMQPRYRTQSRKDAPSDNAFRRRLMQVKETGNAVHRTGEGRPSTS
jgi:hypothetical protein